MKTLEPECSASEGGESDDGEGYDYDNAALNHHDSTEQCAGRSVGLVGGRSFEDDCNGPIFPAGFEKDLNFENHNMDFEREELANDKYRFDYSNQFDDS